MFIEARPVRIFREPRFMSSGKLIPVMQFDFCSVRGGLNFLGRKLPFVRITIGGLLELVMLDYTHRLIPILYMFDIGVLTILHLLNILQLVEDPEAWESLFDHVDRC